MIDFLNKDPKCPVPQFDEEKHKYYIDGKAVPGVNEILKSAGITKDFTGVSNFYRERGIAVHRAIEYYLHDELDESSVDEMLVPYLDGFKEWWKVNKGPFRSELRLYSPTHGFCGTIDLVMQYGISDYKCSKDPDKAAEIQGLMYQQLVAENFGVQLPFSVIQLPGDGLSHEIPSTIQPGDYSLMNAVLKIYEWRARKRVR